MQQIKCPNAMAVIHGGSGFSQICGCVKFFHRSDGVVIEAILSGLPDSASNFFGFHIHEGYSCCGEGFPDTGGHFDSTGWIHPKHAGDLPPLLNCHGKAYLKFFTDRFQINEIIGRTIVIHSDPDDFHTQPSGNAGIKIACGVIQRC